MNFIELYRDPGSMTPTFPSASLGILRELATDLVKKASGLNGSYNNVTRKAIAGLVESMNSYYSNLIEGHKTHPLDIERALKQNYSSQPEKKLLQLESRAHVLVNREMKLKIESIDNVYGSELICWIHKTFYDFLPEQLRKITSKEGKVYDLVPGELRKREVEVGRHIAPAADSLETFMHFFTNAYKRAAIPDPLDRIIAIAAAHHRLAWVHPFLDGNGRVVRLFSEACLIKEQIDGKGLWSISRGLAINNIDYFNSLNNADLKRLNDYDGRGNLSDKYLFEFCNFFLKTAIDQVEFMNALLEPHKTLFRLREFVDLLSARGELKKESIYVLEEALLKGKISRGEMQRLTGKSENVARAIMNNLLEKELLISESHELRSPVLINFPIKYAPYIFPKLFPKDEEATMRD